MTLIAICLIVEVGSAGLLLYATIVAIHRMNRHTNHWIRIGYVLMAIGAFTAMLYPIAVDWHPSPEMLVVLGAAVLLLANQRKSAVVRSVVRVNEYSRHRMQ